MFGIIVRITAHLFLFGLLIFLSSRLIRVEDRLSKLEGGTVEIVVDRTFDGNTGRFGYKLDKVIHEAKRSRKKMTKASVQ